ncbi:hypothetical protein DJ021_08680 [Phenylobacterium hankyongense]|uniref:Uncharacterized protein n=2 Tax=Phenylobacterium hankyongense TaxID=1813876 RepID=A0A328B006_9CAUL|nr:hypothetical protein DJ021_08680 [Phenylobacterium hankyongense]
MMSRACCIERAETCEQSAAECVDTALQAHWLTMAAEWRALAEDGSDQATLARLMRTTPTAD